MEGERKNSLKQTMMTSKQPMKTMNGQPSLITHIRNDQIEPLRNYNFDFIYYILQMKIEGIFVTVILCLTLLKSETIPSDQYKVLE